MRAVCDKYSAITGIDLHPHLFRHTFAHEYLATSQNDAIGLAQLLGHESLETVKRYGARTHGQLEARVGQVTY